MTKTKAVLVLAAAAAAGCSDGAVVCAPYFAYGLTVTVVSGRTGERICDAVVVAREGTYSETLAVGDPGGGCRYIGAPERAGRYSVHAERVGFLPTTVSDMKVVTSGGDCPHVRPVYGLIRLVPAP